MFAVGSFFVNSCTADPMFIDDPRAAAKLPWPIPFIMVAFSVSPTGVIIEMRVLKFSLNHSL